MEERRIRGIHVPIGGCFNAKCVCPNASTTSVPIQVPTPSARWPRTFHGSRDSSFQPPMFLYLTLPLKPRLPSVSAFPLLGQFVSDGIKFKMDLKIESKCNNFISLVLDDLGPFVSYIFGSIFLFKK